MRYSMRASGHLIRTSHISTVEIPLIGRQTKSTPAHAGEIISCIEGGTDMKYRKKPVVIEAFQYDGDLQDSDGEYYVPDWAVKAFEGKVMYYGCHPDASS